MAALSYLDRLQAESIQIMRETVAEAKRPVMLYSIGKDSAVMLHLAKKAFAPAPLPFPLLHVDTGWKFRDMYALRDKVAAEPGIRLVVHKNPDAEAKGINPFDHGPLHTDLWKTEGLRQALEAGNYDAAFGGARRDEEKSRAKERVVSLRSKSHRWDPRAQRPELWALYNVRKAKGESIRVFPLSNWTELDVWRYIEREAIEVVPLYFSAERPVVARELEATVCWLGESPGRVGGRYVLKHTTRSERVKLDAVRESLDVATLTPKPGGDSLGLNDIARVTLRSASELAFDPYRDNRWMGAFILIDEASNDTVGAGMIGV